jgi:hypothetical protein
MELELMPYLENGWCCVKGNVKQTFVQNDGKQWNSLKVKWL